MVAASGIGHGLPLHRDRCTPVSRRLFRRAEVVRRKMGIDIVTRLTNRNKKRLRREPHQECVAAADCQLMASRAVLG